MTPARNVSDVGVAGSGVVLLDQLATVAAAHHVSGKYRFDSCRRIRSRTSQEFQKLSSEGAIAFAHRRPHLRRAALDGTPRPSLEAAYDARLLCASNMAHGLTVMYTGVVAV